MAGWVRLRGPLQVPLRGPAQPLAAARSGGCEAVLRKRSALTHVSSVAASMRLTPPQPDRPRLRQFSAIFWNCFWGQIRFPPENGSDPRLISISHKSVDQGLHLPTAAGLCQRWGGVGVRGVSRMDAAAKPPGTDLRRPRTPTPPRPTTECTLLLLPLLRFVAGAGRSPANSPTPAVGCARAPVRTYPPPASRRGSTTRGSPDRPLRDPTRTTR